MGCSHIPTGPYAHGGGAVSAGRFVYMQHPTDSTAHTKTSYQDLSYTSCGALAETKNNNSSKGLSPAIDPTTYRPATPHPVLLTRV